jgi:hypothetical protein
MTTMYMDDGGGGGAPIQSIMDSMNAFAGVAAAGGIEVSETAGKDLIRVIEDFQHWISANSDKLGLLEQERKLGSSNGAKTMMPYVRNVASDSQGFITQLRALRDSLDKAREGINKAMENYRRTDEASGSAFKAIEI